MENVEVKDQEVKEPEKVEDPKEPVKDPEKVEDKKVDPKTDAAAEKETAKVSEDMEKANKTIADLTKEIEEKKDLEFKFEGVTKELEVANENLKKAADQVKEYETLLGSMVEEKMKQIPDDYQDLIPSNMTVTQQLEWLAKAESKNLFKKESKKMDDVEIGKPMGAAPGQNIDTKGLSASSIFAMAYNTFKG